MTSQKYPGSLALDQAAERIHQIEVGGFVFVGCEVRSSWNVVEFAYAPLPTRLLLLSATATPPANATIFWSGRMLAANREVKVRAYRSLAAIPVATPSAAFFEATAGPVAAKTLMGESAPPANTDPTVATSILSRDTVVARAMSAVDSETVYTMQQKVNPSLAAERWPEAGMRTDCSSFVAWCLRMSVKVPHPLYTKVNGGWLETTAIYEDGMQKTGYFSAVHQASPGSLVVYGDRSGKQGHIGIVIDADGPGVAGVRSVVHCSSGNYKKHGRAIRKTDAAAWLANPHSIIVDYEGFS